MATRTSSGGGHTRPYTYLHVMAGLALLVLSAIGLSEMRVREPAPHFQQHINKAAEKLNCEGHAVRSVYTGFKPVDEGVRFLVIAFLPGVAGLDKGFQILQIYFLFSFFPVISLWCLEAGRKGNRRSWIAYPAVWSLLYQTVGGALVVPLFYLGYLQVSARSDYFSPASRKISDAYAKALAPALIFGYLLPTVLMYLPYSDLHFTQGWIAFWQPCPLLVSLLLFVFSTLLSGSDSREGNVDYLNLLYGTCITTSTILHVGTVYFCLNSRDPEVSLISAFDPRIGTANPTLVLTTGLKYIFQADFWVITATSFIWAFLAIHDLRQIGRTQIGMATSFMCLVVGSITIGPSAVLSAVWFWREQLLAKSKAS